MEYQKMIKLDKDTLAVFKRMQRVTKVYSNALNAMAPRYAELAQRNKIGNFSEMISKTAKKARTVNDQLEAILAAGAYSNDQLHQMRLKIMEVNATLDALSDEVERRIHE